MIFFIREWQRNYSYDHREVETIGNQIMLCPIRDHHLDMYRMIIENNAKLAIEDPGYREKMAEYDKKLSELTDPIWKEEYIAKG